MNIFVIVILSLLFIGILMYFTPRNWCKRQYKYVFKKPNGEICDTFFCIWKEEESMYDARYLAKGFMDKYKYYMVAVVEMDMTKDEIANSNDINWRTRSQMFDCSYDKKEQ